MLRRLSLVFLMAAASFVAGCGGDDSSSSSGTPAGSGGTTAGAKFADVQTIFTGSCALSGSCHNSSSAAGKISLKSGEAYAAVTGSAKYVVAGKPEESLLFKLVSAEANTKVDGIDSMPQGGPKLEAAKIETIKAWIAAGAKND